MIVNLDWDRAARTGLPEAVLCEGKSAADLAHILQKAEDRPLLLTRLSQDRFAELPAEIAQDLQHDGLSRTAFWRTQPRQFETRDVVIVCAGTADRPVAAEAERTLAFLGVGATVVQDVGVAGLWRLLDRVEDISAHRVVVAVAGMEGALFSVLGGLVAAPIIAVPTSNGYGVGAGGRAALSSALATCAQGILAVNIDNGFGAACAAVRILRMS